MNHSDAFLWTLVVAPYGISNAIGFQYLKARKWAWLIGVGIGIAEYVLILSLTALALQAYWVGGECFIPFLIFFLAIGKTFCIRFLLSMQRKDVPRYFLLLIFCIVACVCVFRWIGTPIALSLFPGAPAVEIRITAAQLSYWALTSYPYLLHRKRTAKAK